MRWYMPPLSRTARSGPCRCASRSSGVHVTRNASNGVVSWNPSRSQNCHTNASRWPAGSSAAVAASLGSALRAEPTGHIDELTAGRASGVGGGVGGGVETADELVQPRRRHVGRDALLLDARYGSTTAGEQLVQGPLICVQVRDVAGRVDLHGLVVPVQGRAVSPVPVVGLDVHQHRRDRQACRTELVQDLKAVLV